MVNVSRMFADTAERCFYYIRSLSRIKRPSDVLIISEFFCSLPLLRESLPPFFLVIIIILVGLPITMFLLDMWKV
jgi:hypothetical protein